MPQSTNLNKAPYFDDFDPNSEFYRVLFRPGFSIQSRELTTLQSILQNQVESLAKANFKQGSVVVPGELIVDRQYSYVKISSFTNNLQITDYIGKKMTGASSGIVATVLNATASTTTDSATLFVKYESGGTNNVQTQFVEGETITANSPGAPTAIVGVTGNVKPTASPALGYGSAATVQSGIYFINGVLVKNESETIILEKYSNQPSCKVGFVVSEQLTTSEEDFSLLDNAQGYSNFAAPGAHRLKMSVSLVKRPLDAPEQKDFVQLLEIVGGVSSQTVGIANTNALLEDILARRTFDESGDYVVRDFLLSIKESLQTADNNGVSPQGSESKFVLLLEPGKAYVKGYEIETTSVRYVEVDKARDTETQENNSITPSDGSNYTVTNLLSYPDVESKSQNLTGGTLLSTNAFQEVKLYDKYGDMAFGDTTANLDGTSPEAENYHMLTVEYSTATTAPTVPANWTSGSLSEANGVRSFVLSANTLEAIVILHKSSSIGFTVGESITIGAVSGTIKTAERLSTPYVGIAKTRSFNFLSGSSTAGIYDKDALFKLGLFGVEYFTKIKCKIAVGGFSLGKFITGQTSNARGIVEQRIDATRELILSRVTGEFIPGETLLSEQDGTTTPYNFAEKEGTISELKIVSFGQAYVDVADITAININGVNKLTEIGTSNITVAGNEVRSIVISDSARESLGTFTTPPVVEITATTGYGCSVVAMLNLNNVVSYNSSFAKSFFNSTTGNSFAGDIASTDSNYYVDSGATFDGVEGEYFIKAHNLGSRPDLDLINGDVIRVVDDAGITRKYMVRFAVPDGTQDTARIYVYGSILSAFTTKTLLRIRSKLSGGERNALIYPLPNKHVKTLVLDPNNTNINYTVQKQFLGNLDAAGAVTVTVGTNEQFLGFTASNYVVSNPSTGDLLDVSGSGAVTLTSSNQSLNLNLGASFANVPYKIIAPVRKVDTAPKTKVLVEDAEYNVNTGFSDPIIPAQFADGYRLKSVHMSATTASATKLDVDITDRFTFDGGQRDTHYDLARIVLKPGEIAPTNKLLIVFDYFKHVGGVNTGDYFTVDSYTNIDYKDIPSFESSVYGDISLRDAVDFRPRVSDYDGLDTATVLPGYSDKLTINSMKFTGTGSSAGPVALAGTTFESGYEFYLNRIDSVYISKNGNFVVSKGTSSLNPQIPAEITDAILLYHVNVPAYTYNISDITTKSFDNRRYTMRDIGKLEKRVEKLEYYTVLSLLEQDTFNTQIKDEFGNDRFKNGIIVDNFEGHGIGNTTSLDYNCAVDMQSGVLRPSFASSQTSLIEENLNDSQRSASGYSNKSGFITVKYTEEILVQNKFATKTSSINPNKSAKYTGVCVLKPNIDEWKDTTVAPELIVNENSILDNIKNSADPWGGVWNEWQMNWTGTPSYSLNNSTNSTTSSQFADSNSLVLHGKTRSRTRNGTQNRLTPFGTAAIDRGSRTVATPYNPYIRSKLIAFVAKDLEPDTKLYAYFDGIDVSAWVNPDDVTSITTPFTGIGGYAEKGFGESIVTDGEGNISGMFLIPSGYAPVKGKKTTDFNNSTATFYDDTSTKKSFVVGSKSFRLTSSSTNSGNSEEVTTFAETPYTVSGLPLTNTATIASTRTPYISRRSPSNSDSVQYVNSSLSGSDQSGLLDPMAQTFTVSGFEDGIFLSSIELFFAKKDTPTGEDTIKPVSIYLTETNGGVPTRTVVPFSETTLSSDTRLRIKLGSDVPSGITLIEGETITGKVSGATGTIKSELAVTSANTRYNLILKNHNGKNFVAGEEFTVNRSPAITDTTFSVDYDSGVIDSIDVTNFGSGYSDSTTVNITGDVGGSFGTPATASVKVYGGRIYGVNVLTKGKGYYVAPTVTIDGASSGDGLATATAKLRITDPAVIMGVATSDDASIASKFIFDGPIYLQNDVKYAVIVTSSSKDYELYTSEVGKTILNSVTTATESPNVGSLFKSQNSGAWSEDTLQDLKFNINRCKFETNTVASIKLINEDLDFVSLPENAIFVDNTLGISPKFGANQKVIRVLHPNHGMKEGDLVVLSDVAGTGANNQIFGVPSSLINGLHSVQNVGLDEYCIQIDDALWAAENVSMLGSGSGGGKSAKASTNKMFQVVSPQVATMVFPSSSVSENIRTVYGKPVDSPDNVNLNEYTLAPNIAISANDNFYYEESRVIASNVNEILRAGTSFMNGEKSVEYTLSMSTAKDNVSPVLDLDRANIITASNRMDNPTGDEDRFGTISQTLTVPQTSDFTVNAITPDVVGTTILNFLNATGGTFTNTVDTASRLTQSGSGASGQIVDVDVVNGKLTLIDVIGTFVPGNPITQSGTTANLDSQVIKSGIVIGWDAGTGSLKVKMTTPDLFAVGDIIDDSGAGTSPQTSRTISAVENSGGFLFVGEDKFNSSAASKYLTKEIALENPATGLDCKLTANLFSNDNVKVMYKIRPDGSNENFTNIAWEYFNGTGLSDKNASIVPSNLKSLSPSVEDLESYIEYSYTANSLKPFSSFAIKIIFVGDNPALAPRIEDLRVIANS